MPNNFNTENIVFHITSSADAVAEDVYNYLKDCVSHGVQNIILPGGRTPMPLYKKIAEDNELLQKVNIFLTDERLVEHGSDKSNYGNIIRAYPTLSQCLHSWYQQNDSIPPILKERRSVAVLGVGEDGHFASLFPEDKSFDAAQDIHYFQKENESWQRFSLGYPFFMSVDNIALMLTGASKAIVLKYIQNNEIDKPAVRFIKEYEKQQIVIFCDKAVTEQYENIS